MSVTTRPSTSNCRVRWISSGFRPERLTPSSSSSQQQLRTAAAGVVLDVDDPRNLGQNRSQAVGGGADLGVVVAAHLDVDRLGRWADRPPGAGMRSAAVPAWPRPRRAWSSIISSTVRRARGLGIQADQDLAIVVAESWFGLGEHVAGVADDRPGLAGAQMCRAPCAPISSTLARVSSSGVAGGISMLT